jgi:polysaccharide export outer membrane protein
MRPHLFVLIALSLLGCGHAGSYVWIDDLPASQLADASTAEYTIDSGDMLNVRVLNQESMSTRARVRPDGKIFVPLIGDVVVKGRRPVELAKDLEARLKDFVVAPAVTITAEEVQPVRISVVGEVARPGVYSVEPGSGVLQALAVSGGMTDFADADHIFVLRRGTAQGTQRIRFTYDGLTRDPGKGAAFSLRSGDAVIVE